MRQRVVTALSTFVLLAGMMMGAGIALAGNPAANLDQCANDPSNAATVALRPPTNGCSGLVATETGWVNGNLGASKSVYREGDSIPYRMAFSNLVTGSTVHSLKIEWDTTKAGTHAIDYLTTYNASVGNANPCAGITGCTGAGTPFRIPTDPQVEPGTPVGTGALGGQPAGNFTIWGGAVTAVSAYTYSNGAGFTGDKSAAVVISFTAGVANPVIAWGGHIATRAAWGALKSAVSISGSPYHTRLVSLDGVGGNQDRSLSADAVIFPGSITIIKSVAGGTSQDFSFTETAGTLAPTSFILDVDGDATRSDRQLYSNIMSFGTYAFAEGTVGGWDLTGRGCSVTSPNGGTQNTTATGADGRKITINLAEGENVTCTFTNVPTPAPSLSVTKTADVSTYTAVGDVINYTITVTNNGNISLSNVAVTDANAVGLDCDPVAAGAQTTGFTIAAGDHITCTASHAIVQADLDAGHYYNEACADDGTGGAAKACGNVDVPSTPLPSLLVTKVATESTYTAVGDVINYTITVTNNGNISLSNVAVTDANAVGLDCDPVAAGAQTTGFTIAAGDHITCTASHAIVQADLDAGHYYNEACADDGTGGAAKACGNVDVPATQNPALTTVKVDDLNGGKFENLGDVIQYTITVTNSGNVTLTNVAVTDTNAVGLDCDPNTTGNQTTGFTIAVGAHITCTASHTIVQADLDTGTYYNQACADDGVGVGAARACGDVTTPGKNQPTINTADVLIPQDAVTLAGLTTSPAATGTLYVELRINETCGQDNTPAYSKTWSGADFAGNGTYNTDNAVAVSDDATIRWCSSYSGDANNAARLLSSRGEIVNVDFDPAGILAGGFGFGLSALAWAAWKRIRRQPTAQD